MNRTPHDPKKSLREAAEARLAGRLPPADALGGQTLLHELQVHQIELEMQNETLRLAQNELEQSRDRYVDLYDFSPVGYLTLNRHGLIEQINLTGTSMLGLERKEVLNRRFSTFVVREDRDRWHRHFAHVLNHDERLGCELAMGRGNDTPFHARLDCQRMERDGEHAVVRLALTDVSERKRAEQALIEADRRKDEFLAMLAHELRNPLTPIRNAAHILGRLGLEEPRVDWVRQIIERQVAHLAHLVDDLLDVARIVHGKIVLKQGSIELAAVVSQSLDMARPLFEAKGQNMDIHLPETPVPLFGDPVRLVQILFNLLDNASKYTPNGGDIALNARADGQTVEFKVRDNGMGMSTDLLSRIFDLFQQGERGLDRDQGGLGIGLTLVRRLVEMHGGRLEATSAGPGLGSEFTIWLPVSSGVAATDSKALAEPAPASGHARVLLVEDDGIVSETMAYLLRLRGHEARTAATGEKALELARTFRPRLILLDIGLPDMDGYDLARRLREIQTADIQFSLAALTGYGHEEARRRAGEAGFDHFLVKPVPLDELMALVDREG